MKLALYFQLLGSSVFGLVACQNAQPNPSKVQQASPKKSSSESLESGTSLRNQSATYAHVRMENPKKLSSDLGSVLMAAEPSLGFELDESHFKLTETRSLMSLRYQRFSQIDPSTGASLDKASLRIWTHSTTEQVVLVELYAVKPSPTEELLQFPQGINLTEVRSAALVLAQESEPTFELMKINASVRLSAQKEWVRWVRVESKLGTRDYAFSLHQPTLLSQSYFPRGMAETMVRAQVYPLWEYATDGSSGGKLDPSLLQQTQSVTLERLLPTFTLADSKAYEFAKTHEFKESMMVSNDTTLSDSDWAQGKWNFSGLDAIFKPFYQAKGKTLSNQFSTGKPVRLVGKNVSVFVHPQARRQNPQLLPWIQGPQFLAVDLENRKESTFRMEPVSFGLPALNRLDFARRLPYSSNGEIDTSDTVGHMAMGFDEVQVYHGVDTFLEDLRTLGFGDVQLSTRPFAAILFDPSLGGKNNAYYTNDTINFTTYSPNEPNLARDNPTIWHELGHGIQDRLMGPHVDAALGYGLWEGMADFLAEIIASHKYEDNLFLGRTKQRIFNNTYFFNTNESHDEGEAYGGAMKDMLYAAMASLGNANGVREIANLTFQTMRLLRDHPFLTPQVWFEGMLFADSLAFGPDGSPRTPRKLHSYILASLEKRNYSSALAPSQALAQVDGVVLTDRDVGSRGNRVKVTQAQAPTQRFNLEAKVDQGQAKNFVFPVTVKVTFNGWALQGSNRWIGEEEPEAFVKVLKDPLDVARFTLGVEASCDVVNTSAGLCSDYALVSFYNAGNLGKPNAKYRFYVTLTP